MNSDPRFACSVDGCPRPGTRAGHAVIRPSHDGRLLEDEERLRFKLLLCSRHA
jgi:hypothetical protein